MASGSSYSSKAISQEPVASVIPPRATRELPAIKSRAEQQERETTKVLPITHPPKPKVVDQYREHPLTRHIPWLRRFLLCMVVVIVGSFVLIYAGTFQRPGPPQLVISPNAQVFPIQVGGTLGAVNAWAQSNGPLAPKTPIPTHLGPYSVVGKNSLTVDF